MPSKRLHERYDLTLEVKVLYEGKPYTGLARNLSLGGMFIEADVSIPIGTVIKMNCSIPAMKEETEIEGTVRWHDEAKTGMGVQFGSLRAIEVWALNQLFRGAETID